MAQGHFPFLKSCPSCASARGRAPARRVKHERKHFVVCADFCFFGKIAILVFTAVLTGMHGCVLMGNNHDRNVTSVVATLEELGIGGKAVEYCTDNDDRLLEVLRAAARHSRYAGTGAHFRTAPSERKQYNGIAERAVETVKEGVMTIWIHLEETLGVKLALESQLFGYALGYMFRCFNIHNVRRDSVSTAIDRMRDAVETQRPKTYPFACKGLAAPVRKAFYRGMRLVPVIYLGPKSSLGGGVVALPLKWSEVGPCQVDMFQVFRMNHPVEYNLDDLLPLTAGVKVNPPRELEASDSKDDRNPVNLPAGDREEKESLVPETVPERVSVPVSGPPKSWCEIEGTAGCPGCEKAKLGKKVSFHTAACKNKYEAWMEMQRQVAGEPSGSRIPVALKRKRREVVEGGSPFGSNEARMEITDPPAQGIEPEGQQQVDPLLPGGDDLGMEPHELRDDIDEEGDVRMDEISAALEDEVLFQYWDDEYHEFVDQETPFVFAVETGDPKQEFAVDCGGMKVTLQVPEEAYDEGTGALLDKQQLLEGFKTELVSLDKLQVGVCMGEKAARQLAGQAGKGLLTSRWVLVQKSPQLVRSRLVVRDYRRNGLSAMKEHIYAPTSSLEALRLCLAVGTELGMGYTVLDVSVAFMYAKLKTGDLQLVLLPDNIRGPNQERVAMKLSRAMNGLRKAPLLWFREFSQTLIELGATVTSECTLFRLERKGRIMLILIYVDDVLVCSQSREMSEWLVAELTARYRIKQTGDLAAGECGSFRFLGRTVVRTNPGNGVCMGLPQDYVTDMMKEWKDLKPTKTVPDLEKLFKQEDEKHKGKLLSVAAAVKYRKTLGQLAWCALSRCDLSYCTAFLARSQSKPLCASESCLRAVLRYVAHMPQVCQEFPAPCPPHEVLQHGHEIRRVLCFVDASWGIPSVSGGLVMWKGHAIQIFSRRQLVPALSSVESELIALTEVCKASLSVSMLLQTALEGITIGEHGMPSYTTTDFSCHVFIDSSGGRDVAYMLGLQRRIRHLQLRVQFVQHLIEVGQLTLDWIKGDRNPVDALTKTPTTPMLENLRACVGLKAMQIESSLSEAGEDGVFDDVFGEEERLDVTHQDETPNPKVSSKADLKKQVTFGEHVEMRSFPIPSKRFGDLVSTAKWRKEQRKVSGVPGDQREVESDHVTQSAKEERAELCGQEACPVVDLPLKSVTELEVQKAIEEVPVWRDAFEEISSDRFYERPLVIEVCCERESAMKRVCERNQVIYLGVTQDARLEWKPTKVLIRAALDRLELSCVSQVYVHLSTPCTSGCRWQYVNRKINPRFQAKWMRDVQGHHAVWRAVSELFVPITLHPRVVISHEWPRNNLLWNEPKAHEVRKRLNLWNCCVVQRCHFDGIHKCWLVTSNSDRFIKEMRHLESCVCEVPRKVSAKVTGTYPEAFAQRLLRAAQLSLPGSKH